MARYHLAHYLTARSQRIALRQVLVSSGFVGYSGNSYKHDLVEGDMIDPQQISAICHTHVYIATMKHLAGHPNQPQTFGFIFNNPFI